MTRRSEVREVLDSLAVWAFCLLASIAAVALLVAGILAAFHTIF